MEETQVEIRPIKTKSAHRAASTIELVRVIVIDHPIQPITITAALSTSTSVQKRDKSNSPAAQMKGKDVRVGKIDHTSGSRERSSGGGVMSRSLSLAPTGRV